MCDIVESGLLFILSLVLSVLIFGRLDLFSPTRKLEGSVLAQLFRFVIVEEVVVELISPEFELMLRDIFDDLEWEVL